MTKKWNKKKEERYEDICLGEDYDEEYCYEFVTREDDSDFDYGESEEGRYI
ncbi:ORF B50 [Sulfolobus virus Ragged Hills]|uniref:ORF B50 n=1 Tax=Sulfolobus virus Ragged Hills TaxID=256994 RepID=Q6TRU5_9VIRU|nr:ORF B50 [Sulfolobus virus Ragged Hills]AAR27916.1 ORF B50 [Sulfolobus virus Ragged Hills]